MKARLLLAFALLLAGVLVLALVRSGRDAAPRADVGPATAHPREPVAQQQADRASLATPDETARGAALGETRTDPEATAPAGDDLRVRVVDSQGRPIGGVPVGVFGTTLQEPLPMPVVRAQTSEDDGTAALTVDLRGKELPPGTRFHAAIDLPLRPRVERDLGGWTPGQPWTAGAVELELPANAEAWLEPLLVQVVDAQGEPVPDATVLFVARLGAGRGESQLARGTTRAPDGIAQLSREEQRERSGLLDLLQVEPELAARCLGPFVPPPEVRVPERPSREPLRLVLPPTGSVLARLSRQDGSPVAAGGGVALGYYAAGSDERAGYVRLPVEAGLARFERVGLGLDLRLTGSLDDGSVERAEEVRVGPLLAGEQVEVELTLGGALPRLVGRILDGDGAPAREFLFFLAVDERDPPPRHPAAGPRRPSRSPQATDGAGRFSIPWRADLDPAGRFLRFEERPHPQHGAPPGWVPRFVDAAYPAASADGLVLDVGDLALEEVPVIVAGRVVDSQGAPVSQAWLSIGYPVGEGKDERWYNLALPGVSRLPSRDDGSFVARSRESVRALRVSASRNRVGTSATLEVAPGTRDVLLVLEPPEDTSVTRGRLRGRLLLDADLPLMLLEVALRGPRGQKDTFPLRGRFRFDELVPGTYRLLVRATQTDLVFETVEDLVVQAGLTNRDARLQGLDLRGRIGLLRLRLLAAVGEPLGDEQVHLGVGAQRGRLRTDDEGRLATLLPTTGDPAVLTVEGFEPIEVLPGPAEQVVVLTRR